MEDPRPVPPSDSRVGGQVWTVVVAAGSASRYGSPKQFATLGDRRVVDWSLAAARAVSDGVVLVVPSGDSGGVEAGRDADVIVTGSDTRSGSVRTGLSAVPSGAEVIVVHDAARPAAAPSLFRAVIDAVRAGADAAVPGVALVDSVRHRDGAAVDREELVAVQTPQAFRATALRTAHAEGADASDDATLVERSGGRVVVVPGDPDNVKLTHLADLDRVARSLGVVGSAATTGGAA